LRKTKEKRNKKKEKKKRKRAKIKGDKMPQSKCDSNAYVLYSKLGCMNMWQNIVNG